MVKLFKPKVRRFLSLDAHLAESAVYSSSALAQMYPISDFTRHERKARPIQTQHTVTICVSTLYPCVKIGGYFQIKITQN